MKPFKALIALCLGAALAVGSVRAEYPEQPIRIIVPYPADAAGLRQYPMAEIERELRIIERAKIPKQ